MIILRTSNTFWIRKGFLNALAVSSVLICTACNNTPDPDKSTVAKTEPTAPTQQATGLVKNPTKLHDVADTTKWMDIASSKSAAQIAKEQEIAENARQAKLAADAKAVRDAQLAATAKSAADAKAVADARLAADTKAAADAKAQAIALENQRTQAAAAQAALIAKATPAAPAEPVAKVLTQEQPAFPIAASKNGVTSGVVTALAQIEPDGHVSGVKIIKASPANVFDKAVVSAVMRWKYAPISKSISTKLEFSFKRDSDGS